jgi:hypothetical protein
VIPWKRDEKIAFERFPTPNDLAEALSDPDEMRQDRAFTAIEAIIHTRLHFTYWLKDIRYLESRMDRIAFIGFQETYDDDLHRLLRVLGVRRQREIPVVHQAPTSSGTTLSEAAITNLEAWYARDREIYVWALEQRHRWEPPPEPISTGPQADSVEQARQAKRARNRARRARQAAKSAAGPSASQDHAPAAGTVLPNQPIHDTR